MHESFELIDRASRRLAERGLVCAIAGGVSEAAIAAAEEALACTFPPSYRGFLRRFGALVLPPRASTVHHFVGLGGDDDKTVLARTQHARVENRLGRNLLIVALGVEAGEWFCVDLARPRHDGECPIFLFDARDNQLDQQFYDDFGSMLHEVLTFVHETLDEAVDLSAAGADDASDETALGGVF